MEENTAAQEQKLTYEQLESVCHQLSEQNRNLFAQLQSREMEAAFKRLDFLFKVIEHVSVFEAEDSNFVTSCIKEIIAGLTIPEKEETEEEK